MEEKRWISLPQLSVLNEAGEEVELEDQLLAGMFRVLKTLSADMGLKSLVSIQNAS